MVRVRLLESFPMVAGRVDVRIVLVRPRNPLNIGAAARAMRNFGFEDLVVVRPHEPVWQEARAAPGAEEILRQARVVADLPAAVEDRNWVAGTSSLSRRQPSQSVLGLDELAAERKKRFPHRMALVFGPEKTGLSNRDLSYCHTLLRIPTLPDCPSMNLGQAVAVCCYELRRSLSGDHRRPEPSPERAAVGEVERLVEEVGKLVAPAKANSGAENRRQRELRQRLLRWPLSSRDVTLVLGILRDLSWRLRRDS